MTVSDSPKIYAGMLKKELIEVADRMGLTGVKKLRKAELIDQIQDALRRRKKSRAKKASEKKGGESSQRTRKKPALTKAEKPTAKTSPAATAKRQVKKSGAVEGDAREGAPTSEVKGERPKSDGGLSEQSRVTAVKYGAAIPFSSQSLRDIDAHLPGLPEGYGRDRVVLLPRDPEWLYCYWDVRHETKGELRERGGVHLALRLYEARGEELEPMVEHWVQEYTNSWYLRAPSPGRVYLVELGYRDGGGEWLVMLRSNVAEVPPSGPSTIIADRFVTISPDQPLPKSKRGGRAGSRRVASELAAAKRELAGVEGGASGDGGHEAAHHASTSAYGLGAPGSMTGSGAGGPFAGSPRSGAPWAGSRVRQEDASAEGAERDKDYWLVADAELVVFGATVAGSTVTLGGQKIRLRQDGSFSVRMAFPNGKIEIPIEAVASDGEQRRGVELRFDRETSRED